MAKTPKGLGHGEGGSRTPKLEKLLNEIAEDLETVFNSSTDLYDAERKHRKSSADEAPVTPSVLITEDNLETAFTTETAPNTYTTDVVVKVEEENGIETEDLTIDLVVLDSDDAEEFSVTETAGTQLKESDNEFTLAVDNTISNAGEYISIITVSGENFSDVVISHEFELTA